MEDQPDYVKLGFKCGLEIHQRLATKTKLFCQCDAQLPDGLSVAEIDRRQRAVAGELGSIDPSATFETSRRRKFVYNSFRKSTCLVDIDEEPPHELNQEALEIALIIASSLHVEVPSEFEPMRKEVVDGSDPSAFQRTLLIGHDGYMNFGNRKICIPTLFLEEESSGIDYSDDDIVVYNVDRLGIPLVEISTTPDIRTPVEAKEVAKRIGLMLRLTGKVQRGIGSIRQDVNVSIQGGARVEIKGFQELDTMDSIIVNEVRRQLELIKIMDELQKRGAKVHEAHEVTEIFAGSKVRILRKSIDAGGVIFASRLEGFAGLMGREINPDRRLGSEISDYAKLAGIGGIIHSDEKLSSYGFEDEELNLLRKKLEINEGDAFMLVTGKREMCIAAIKLASKRADYAINEIPNETRVSDSKRLITLFERPLPGGARMYPETDVRPVPLDAGKYRELGKSAVDIEKISKRLESEIGNRQLVEQMLWSPYLALFSKIVERTGVSGSVVAPILLEKTKQIRRTGIDVDKIGDDVLIFIFEKYKDGKITKVAIEEILKKVPASKEAVNKCITENKLERMSGKALEKVIASINSGKSREEVVKEIMSKYRLNVDGDELNGLLKG
jgi:glutamyl-tRNA(Gln) amidotransferase subunit E